MADSKKRCEECDSTQTYIRLILNERVCQNCGHIEKLEVVKNE